jgi:hypothetical protein
MSIIRRSWILGLKYVVGEVESWRWEEVGCLMRVGFGLAERDCQSSSTHYCTQLRTLFIIYSIFM